MDAWRVRLVGDLDHNLPLGAAGVHIGQRLGINTFSDFFSAALSWLCSTRSQPDSTCSKFCVL